MFRFDRTALKIAATVLAAGIAGGASIGAFGGLSSGEASDNASRSGVVDLTIGTNTLNTPLGTLDNPLRPGDEEVRFITLTNEGQESLVDLANVRLHVGLTVTGDTNTREPDTTPATASEVADDLLVMIHSCSVPWTGSGFDATCSTSASPDGVGATSYGEYFPIADIDTLNDAEELTLFADQPGVLPRDSSAYLKVRFVLRPLVDLNPSTSGATTMSVWTFSADQRAASSSQ